MASRQTNPLPTNGTTPQQGQVPTRWLPQFNGLVTGGLLATAGLLWYGRERESEIEKPTPNTPAVSTPAQSFPQSSKESLQEPALQESQIPVAVEPTPTRPQPSLPSVFCSVAHLVGKKLPPQSLASTQVSPTSGKAKQVDMAEQHADSIICVLPGVMESRLLGADGTWRAGWEAVSQGASCESSIGVLEQNYDGLRANGLSLAIVSGERLPSASSMPPGVSIVWDRDSSFLRSLDIEPLRYQGQAFHPRITMLVRNGEIVAAFSAATNFETSVRKLLALSRESFGTAPTKETSSSSEAPKSSELQEKNADTAQTPKQDDSTAEVVTSNASATQRDDTQPSSPEESSKLKGALPEDDKPALEEKPAPSPAQQLTAFMSAGTLIGKELAASPVFKAVCNGNDEWSRNEIIANKALRSAVIVMIPGPIDWSAIPDNDRFRKAWEIIPGTASVSYDLKALDEATELLKKKGLDVIVMTGAEQLFSLSTLASEHPALTAVSDYRGSFSQSLGIVPFKAWTPDANAKLVLREFYPRVTLLVIDGKIEQAFSETGDFKGSLLHMVSALPDQKQQAKAPENTPPPASSPSNLNQPSTARESEPLPSAVTPAEQTPSDPKTPPFIIKNPLRIDPSIPVPPPPTSLPKILRTDEDDDDEVEDAPPQKTPPPQTRSVQKSPSSIIGKTFDLTQVHFDYPIFDEGSGNGDTLLYKGGRIFATGFAYLKVIARGLETVRAEIGEIPRGYRVKVFVSNGHYGNYYFFDPADIPASHEINSSNFRQISSKSSLAVPLSQLHVYAGRLNMQLNVSNRNESGTDFSFTPRMRNHVATISLELVRQ